MTSAAKVVALAQNAGDDEVLDESSRNTASMLRGAVEQLKDTAALRRMMTVDVAERPAESKTEMVTARMDGDWMCSR